MDTAINGAFDAQVFLAKVGTGKTISEFRKNQNVFAQGDVADTVFYIQKGKVKLTVASDQGKEAVVAILEPGQFFGEGCMNGHALRIATTTTMEDCLITVITKAAMIAAIHDEPQFSELFMAYLLTRNSRIEEDLIGTSCSIRVSGVLRACFCCSPISARKVGPSRSVRTLVRKHWRR
jgi:CRP/FNR family transcriptional regulator, cyclic AMP receptor protein